MGSSRTLTWQCIALVAIVVVFALAAPVESKFWVMLTGLAAAAFFIVVSLARHQQIKRLAGEIDEVLHNGRRIDFSTSSEGDVAVLTNELQKMVARLARTTEQLEAERNALANSLAELPASLGLLRPVSATGGGLRAPLRFACAVFRACALRVLATSALRAFTFLQAFALQKMPEMTYTPSFLIRASFFRYFVNTLCQRS